MTVVYTIHNVCGDYETTETECARVHQQNGFKVTARVEQ